MTQTNTPDMKSVVSAITVAPAEHSTIKIEGEIPYALLLTYRSAALKALGKDVAIDGFRKGHIPEEVLVKRIGEMTLLTEMAERALAAVYPEVIREHTLDVIGHPQISLTKLAPENPLGFSATVAVLPAVTLPDYKKIARDTKKDASDVTDADVTKATEDMLRQKQAYERMQKKAVAKKDAGEDGVSPASDEQDTEDEPLPELTDEYVKTLGSFTSVDEFKSKLREHLEIEKKQEVIGKHRAAITDTIVAESTIDLPQILIDSEIDQMFGQMKQDLTRANLSMDDYLGHIKKTKDELRTEWLPAAEKRAKLQLALNEIAKKESITVPDEQVEKEATTLLAQYKDADPMRVRLYIRSMLTNDATMRMLEEESEKSSK